MTPSPTPGAALSLRRLTKEYAGRAVVDDVSLDIAPGEFVTLLGPSGSGKTTTLSMIAGFCDVTSGEILLDGNPVEGVRPHKRGIGVVFQHYALFPHMSVGDNVGYPLRQRRVGRDERRRRVADALALVDLAGMERRLPRQLSGGQQQRVALARALVFNPRVLLMDEPLGALDKKLRESMQREIKRLHREVGITFVYVTHDQEEALGLSDRIAIFNHGRIEQVGTAPDLYRAPASVFVADFVGESNRITGAYTSERGLPAVRGDGATFPAPRSPLVEGAEAVLILRPEHVALARRSQDATGHGLSGEVTEVLDHGWSRRLEVRLTSGERLTAREVGARADSLDIGSEVTVTYDAAHTVVLPG